MSKRTINRGTLMWARAKKSPNWHMAIPLARITLCGLSIKSLHKTVYPAFGRCRHCFKEGP